MYLIKSNDVKGDVNIGSFKDCFKVLCVEFESGRQTMQAPLGSSARKFGPVRVSPIRIVKEYCKASSAIQENCSFGKTQEMKLYFLDNNNSDYIEITLTDAVLSGYKFTAHGGEAPHEAFDITYTSITTRQTPRNEKGIALGSPTNTSYNLSKQKKS
jgi:type VI protein secretion system component Hcp